MLQGSPAIQSPPRGALLKVVHHSEFRWMGCGSRKVCFVHAGPIVEQTRRSKRHAAAAGACRSRTSSSIKMLPRFAADASRTQTEN
jgi:hypothetical protein